MSLRKRRQVTHPDGEITSTMKRIETEDKKPKMVLGMWKKMNTENSLGFLALKLQHYGATDVGMVTDMVLHTLLMVTKLTKWFLLRIRKNINSARMIQRWWEIQISVLKTRFNIIISLWKEYEDHQSKADYQNRKKYLRRGSEMNIHTDHEFTRDYFRKWVPEDLKEEVIRALYLTRVRDFKKQYQTYQQTARSRQSMTRMVKYSAFPELQEKKTINPPLETEATQVDRITEPFLTWFSELKSIPADKYVRLACLRQMEKSAAVISNETNLESSKRSPTKGRVSTVGFIEEEEPQNKEPNNDTSHSITGSTNVKLTFIDFVRHAYITKQCTLKLTRRQSKRSSTVSRRKSTIVSNLPLSPIFSSTESSSNSRPVSSRRRKKSSVVSLSRDPLECLQDMPTLQQFYTPVTGGVTAVSLRPPRLAPLKTSPRKKIIPVDKIALGI